jgi:hypothetical protein
LRQLRAGAIIVLATIILNRSAVAGTDSGLNQQSAVNERDPYTELYDLLFPRKTELDPDTDELVLTLRYWLTNRSADFQYSLTKSLDGKFKLVAMRTRRPLNSYLDPKYPVGSMNEQELREAREIVKSIPIERKEIALPRRMAQSLISGYLAASAPSLKDLNLIHFDGTRYDLWLEAGTERASYSLSGEALGARKSANALVSWMNRAHKALFQTAWGRVPSNTSIGWQERGKKSRRVARANL